MNAPNYFSEPETGPGRAATFARELIADVRDWCPGRIWLWRLPILLLLAWIGARQFWDVQYPGRFFSGIDLGIHEAGHLLTSGLGQFVCSLSGTLLQCAVPVISMFIFLKQRDYFGIAVCFGWLSINLVHVGVYMADAKALALPLVTVGGGAGSIEKLHDWRYLFGRLGLLNQCEAIGAMTRFAGHVAMLACLAFGAWLLWQMFKQPKPQVHK